MAQLEIQLSKEEKISLANSGDDAAKALYGQGIAGPITLESCRWLTPQEVISLESSISNDKFKITVPTKNALLGFLGECKKNPGVSPAPNEETKQASAPETISHAAWYARQSVSIAFKNPGESGYKERLSLLHWIVGKFPWFEPSSQADIGDAIYQSRQWNLNYIKWLEEEYSKNTNSFDISAKWSGMWPYIGETTTFNSVEEKRKVIKAMLEWLGDTLKNPDVQAGWIVSFLGEWLIKKTLITVGWTTLVVLATGVMLWKWWKWVLVKTLGTVWTTIAAAIGGAIKNGTQGAMHTAWENKVIKSALKWWAAWLAVDVVTGMPGVWTVSGAVAGGVYGARTGNPTTVETGASLPTRELDLSKNLDRMVHENTIREMYMQANAWTVPTSSQIKDMAEDIKNGAATTGEIAEYNKRISRFVELWDRPSWDAKKMIQYDAQVERIIKWEPDPKKWNLRQRMQIKWDNPVNARGMEARLRQTILDAKSDRFTVGSNTYEINLAAKAPLEEIRSFEEQVKNQETKITELKAAQKKLNDRLKDEKKYTQARHDLIDIDTKIQVAKDLWNDALAEAETQKSAYGETSTQYRTARSEASTREVAHQKLVDKRGVDITTKQSLESKYTEIDRWLVVDGTGKLTDSITLQKIESTTNPHIWVKEKMRIAEAEIARLNGELNIRMTTLNGINSKVPNAWNKAGIDVVLPDGNRVRVSQLSALLETLAKAMVKK